MNPNRYCPRCEAKVSPYLGQADIYHCGICGQSYDKQDTLDLDKKTERQKPSLLVRLVGKRNYPDGGENG